MNLEQKAIELLEALEGAAPQGLELMAQVAYYESLFAIIFGFVFLAVAVFLVYMGIRSLRDYQKDYEENGYVTRYGFPRFHWWFISAFVPGLVALINLFSWWNWIGVFDPALRVAYHIMRSFGS